LKIILQKIKWVTSLIISLIHKQAFPFWGMTPCRTLPLAFHLSYFLHHSPSSLTVVVHERNDMRAYVLVRALRQLRLAVATVRLAVVASGSWLFASRAPLPTARSRIFTRCGALAELRTSQILKPTVANNAQKTQSSGSNLNESSREC